MANILVCTLGRSWGVIPEVYGFVAPEVLDLYRHHPDAQVLRRERDRCRIDAPQEIWVITTGTRDVDQGLEKLRAWSALLPTPPVVRAWRGDGVCQIASPEECRIMRELALRCVLRARETCGPGGQLVLSLAGGRKTMSADLQRAGAVFGYRALVHVIDVVSLPQELRDAQPDLLARPLPAPLAGAVRPLVVAEAAPASELLEVELDDRPAVRASRFPLPDSDAAGRYWAPETNRSLADEIRTREQAGSELLGSYLRMLGRDERHQSWRALYRLRPAVIDRLRSTRLDEKHRAWLHDLPKADLHCHLGGVLSLDAQRRVGRAIWEAASPTERSAALAAVGSWLREEDGRWPADWPQRLRVAEAGERRSPYDRALRAAALLCEAGEGALRHNLYETTEPRFALATSRGFRFYELPGELTGSAVLGHPSALEPYVDEIVAYARASRIRYLELRGSPSKVARPEDALAWLERLAKAFEAAIARTGTEPREELDVAFLVIVDRRDTAEAAEAVRLAVDARERLGGFVLGLDLAGDEATARPEALTDSFHRAFEACMPVTVHAGEGEPAASIWEAAYRLHADRVGHGLSLAGDEKLRARFRDRGIALEMCPTSNLEVVGFRDPARRDSGAYDPYPLLALWRAGVPLAICTDNPGISRTTLVAELLTAARLCDAPGDGLTLWDALSILKQGFRRAFLPASRREQLLKEVDAVVYRKAAGWFTQGRGETP